MAVIQIKVPKQLKISLEVRVRKSMRPLFLSVFNFKLDKNNRFTVALLHSPIVKTVQNFSTLINYAAYLFPSFREWNFAAL